MKALLKAVVVFLLTLEARIVLVRHKPKVVAITGSVGKTSTKDAIFTLLSHGTHARKSQKSFNSEFGVPLTVLGLPTAWSSPLAWLENIWEGLLVALFSREYPEWLVLEVGADRPGDIRRAGWVQPHVAVYTHFPDVPVHVEFFDSPEAVMTEKRELGKALRTDGTLVVNADDPKMQHEELMGGQHVLSYGFAEHASVRATDVSVAQQDGVSSGMVATIQFQDQSFKIMLPGVLGRHHLYGPLAAITVAAAEGRSLAGAAEVFAEHASPPGRMRMLKGKDGVVLIDDTYNASPAAVGAGLDALELLPKEKKRVVILGDMMELGSFSAEAHRMVGEHVAKVAHVFIAVGVRMRGAAEAAEAENMHCAIHTVRTVEDAIGLLSDVVGEGSLVYVKGSQSMRMERAVEELLAESEHAKELLVRQEKEWKER